MSEASAIHPTAQAGWGGRGAVDYETGRPGYPRAAVELIATELGVGPGDVVLDLAAGTGKFTRALVAGLPEAEVIAVEPVAEMRDQLAAAVPEARVLSGTAEAIPVDDGSVRAVTVAQAFHWFDVPRATAEIVRVLTDGGGLAFLGNQWADGGWTGALRDYVSGAAPKPETHGRDWVGEIEATGRFGPLSREVVPNPQPGTLETLLARVASMSFISALPDAERARVLDGARELLTGYGLGPGVEIEIPLRTVIGWGRKR